MLGKVNEDLDLPAKVRVADVEWLSSPTPGVWRRPLERDGEEVARASTVVRFEAGCMFPRHVHGGGEEFLVLEGVFTDEDGDYPEGTYVRHPIGSEHAPWSTEGCTIFVKLRQMSDPTEQRLVVNTKNKEQWVSYTMESQLNEPVVCQRLLLYENIRTGERVWMEQWAKDTQVQWEVAKGGEELLLLEGCLVDEVTGESDLQAVGVCKYEGLTWLRLPPAMAGQQRQRSSPTGCKFWIKTGHLANNNPKAELVNNIPS
jgi:quercetin dioxygenase-like cupin family protein